MKFIDKIPEDGLCGKTDGENLWFTYDALDRYIRDGVCEDVGIKIKIDKMHLANLHKLNPIPSYKPKFKDKKVAILKERGLIRRIDDLGRSS